MIIPYEKHFVDCCFLIADWKKKIEMFEKNESNHFIKIESKDLHWTIKQFTASYVYSKWTICFVFFFWWYIKRGDFGLFNHTECPYVDNLKKKNKIKWKSETVMIVGKRPKMIADIMQKQQQFPNRFVAVLVTLQRLFRYVNSDKCESHLFGNMHWEKREWVKHVCFRQCQLRSRSTQMKLNWLRYDLLSSLRLINFSKKQIQICLQWGVKDELSNISTAWKNIFLYCC